MSESEEESQEEQQEEEMDIPQPSVAIPQGQPKIPLLQEYNQEKQKQEQGDQSERSMLEGRIRAIIHQNPKIDAFKSSPLQTKFDEMSIEELRLSLKSCQDQMGMTEPFGLAKSLVEFVDKALQLTVKRAIHPEAKKDVQLLSTLDSFIPASFGKYGDYVQLAQKLCDALITVNELDKMSALKEVAKEWSELSNKDPNALGTTNIKGIEHSNSQLLTDLLNKPPPFPQDRTGPMQQPPLSPNTQKII
jgi:hypothetical protein